MFAGVSEQRAAAAAVGCLRNDETVATGDTRARAGRAIVFFGHVPPSHTCSRQSLAKPLVRRRRSDHQTLRVDRKRRIVSTRENGRYEPYRHLNVSPQKHVSQSQRERTSGRQSRSFRVIS